MEKVRHRKYGEGNIIKVEGDIIKVLFVTEIKRFPYPNSLQDGTLTPISSPVYPTPIRSTTTTANKYRNIFFCFQGKQFEHESIGGYIFALSNTNISHWNRLRCVKEGDIIFHCVDRSILAIGVSTGKYSIEKRPQEHYLATDAKGKDGYKVPVKYYSLRYPVSTCYEQEIIRLQGNCEGKGYPFNKNGKGNYGYLFNLNKSLAKFFMERIIRQNPFLIEKDFVQDFLQ